MLAIGMGLMSSPRLLLLDEPTLGLAPSVKHELGSKVEAIRETGVSLVLIDGDLSFVLGRTDRWLGVETGRVVACGRSTDDDARDAILGLMMGRHHG
jgi:ABC-type branched-subunit amino acid transport system ATPase component